MVKIGWGTRIAILYVGFVLLIVTMVIMCVNQKIDLVSEDYYQKELLFQSRIDESKNAESLNEKITHAFINESMEIKFPETFKGKQVTGDVVFFRPSDASKDYTTSIQLNDELTQAVSLNHLSKGMYKMQIDWKSNGTNYFNEETIVIP
jgi:hypothetical protein